jgi:hypothetical protein
MKLLRSSIVVASLLLAAASTANAGFVDTVTGSATGTLNQYHDTSFEAVIYADSFGGTHGVQAGDIIVGFNQINQKTAPGSVFTTNTIYDVFSETVGSVTGGTTQPGGYVTGGTGLNLSPTNSGTWSLQNILAGLNDVNGKPIVVPNNTIAIVFDRAQGNPYGINEINNPPPGATSIAGYLQYAAQNGVNELSAGFGKANDFVAVAFAVPGLTLPVTNDEVTPSLLNTSPPAQTFGDFQGGLSILQNNTGLVFGPVKLLGNTYGITITSGVGQTDGTDPNYTTWALGSNSTGGGFQDSANFNVDVIVPEPSSIVLVGFGCVSLLAGAYSRKRKSAVAA